MARRGKSGRRSNASSSKQGGLVVTRTQHLGSLPAGNSGFQFTALFSVYPDEATLSPIAKAYSEYRFTKYEVKLIPRCSTTTQGVKWAGFGYSVPFQPADFAQVSALAGNTITQSFSKEGLTRLNASNAGQKWYPVLQTALTTQQRADPNIVQAFLYAGSQGVQSGVGIAEIQVAYTVQFRGPVAAVTGDVPAVVASLPTLPSDEDDED
jgi:hypothetical protein